MRIGGLGDWGIGGWGRGLKTQGRPVYDVVGMWQSRVSQLRGKYKMETCTQHYRLPVRKNPPIARKCPPTPKRTNGLLRWGMLKTTTLHVAPLLPTRPSLIATTHARGICHELSHCLIKFPAFSLSLKPTWYTAVWIDHHSVITHPQLMLHTTNGSAPSQDTKYQSSATKHTMDTREQAGQLHKMQLDPLHPVADERTSTRQRMLVWTGGSDRAMGSCMFGTRCR